MDEHKIELYEGKEYLITDELQFCYVQLLGLKKEVIGKVYILDTGFAITLDGRKVKGLSEYDEKVLSSDEIVIRKVRAALCRLEYPLELQEGYKKRYINYLKNFAHLVIPLLISRGETASISILASVGAIDQKNINSYLEQANRASNIDILAVLIDYKDRTWGIEPLPTLEIAEKPLADDFITHVTDDDSVKIIGYQGNKRHVVFPSLLHGIKVSSIGGCLGSLKVSVFFPSMKKVRKVILENGIEVIDDYAFLGCEKLGSIVIPSSVQKVGKGAFYGCESLLALTLPDGVVMIGEAAFQNCRSINTFGIPPSVSVICDSAFSGCTGLTSINIPEGVTEIGEEVFAGCTSLNSITIPQRVNKIGRYAFYSCTSLTSITIPEGVTEIGEGVFSGCTSLKSLVIPKEVIKIGRCAFDGCTSLTSITIPEGVTEIREDAFAGCISLISITIPEGVSWVSYNLVSNTPFYEALPGNIKITGGYLLRYIGQEKKVVIPSKIKIICPGAFEDCASLTSINIPEGVTEIGDRAFSGCTGLFSITIPAGVTKVGWKAFSGCTRLTSINIPEGVIEIGWEAFLGCAGLTSITISEGVTEIGLGAFLGCDSLVIRATKGSYAIEYAKEHDIKYVET